MKRNTGMNDSVFKFIKRSTDICFSLFLGVVTLPIVLLTIILIRVETPGKAIYTQERVGMNNKKIKIRKLRSMYIDAEKNGAKWAEKNDLRITKIGKIIRKTRIDELPQLWNVFIGEMSLIGPRPERNIFIIKFEKEIPNFRDRLRVKPGLSGYAQVYGGYDLSPNEKFELDMYYINNYSFNLDLKIFIMTIKTIFTGSGAR